MDGKNVVLVLRLPEQLKKSFENVCVQQDRTASQIIRDLMRLYVRDHEQLELENIKGVKK